MSLPTIEILDEESPNQGALSVKKRSPVHDHFTFSDRDKKYKCNYCSKLFAKEKTSGTGNLLKHLRNKHPLKLEGLKKSADAESAKPKPGLFEKKVFSKDALNRLLVEFILLTDQPFSIVEAETFLQLLNYNRAVPMEIPKRDTIRRNIDRMFEAEKQKIVSVLQDAPGKISLVVDCWSTKNGHCFQGILATFVDINWKFQQVVLDFDILEGRHKGKKLAESIFKVLQEYGITNKLLSITSDNASNMDTMLSELREMLKGENIVFNIEDQRVRCLAHVINLSCQAALKVLKETNIDGSAEVPDPNDAVEEEMGTISPQIASTSAGSAPLTSSSSKFSVYGRLKKAISKIRNSNVLRDSLKHFCDVNQIPALMLLTDMPVRWNSTLKMLERCLELRKALDATMKSDSSLACLALTEAEWKLVECMIKFLQPFSDMTDKMSKQHVPLMSLTAAIYIDLYNHLESFKKELGHHKAIVSAARLACDKLNHYYPKTDGLVYLMGIVLDPRCKFEWHKSVGYEKLVPGFKRTVSRCWNESYKSVQEATVEEPVVDDIIKRQMKRARIDARDELERYLAEDPCDLMDSPDAVLLWWKEHGAGYPQLSKMARDFLGIAGSGVPVECLFSMGTDLLTPKRLSMIAETIRSCLCLKGWLKFQGKDALEERAKAVALKIKGEDRE